MTLLQRRWWCSGLKGAVPGRLAEQLEAIQQLHSPFFSDSGDVEEGGTGGDSWKADGMRKKKSCT